MKQIPNSFRHLSESSGATEMFTPNAVSTSALPHLLEAARFPCFATGRPAPAMTKAAAVDTLNVLAQLEPVPAVSMNCLWWDLIRTARARMASAKPASSSTVSPLSFSAISAAPIWPSVASPSRNQFSSCDASDRERCSLRINRERNLLFDPDIILGAGPARRHIPRAGQALPVQSQIQEIREQLLAFGRHDRFGMKLYAFDFHLAMSQT